MATILFLGNLGGGEVILILLLILIFFGSKKIPELARGLGKGMREFKDATQGIQKEIRDSTNVVDEELKSIKKETEK